MPASDQSQQLTSPQPVDGVSPIGSAVNPNRFSRLHLTATSPDWMAPLPHAAASSSVAAKPTLLSAPAPVGATAAPQTAPAASSRSAGFLSMFYRTPAAAESTAPSANSIGQKVPQPPAAIGGTATPPLPPVAMPVDVALTFSDDAAVGRPQTADARIASPIRREGVRIPLALGSDTWNALGTATLPRARPIRVAQSMDKTHGPAPIDAAPVSMTAPKPLWSELPVSHEGRHNTRSQEAPSAPTLDAFRPGRRVPEPPKPISTSPLREADVPSPAAVAVAANSAQPLVPPHPLRPVGEDDAPLTPVRKPTETIRGFFRGAQVRPQHGGKVATTNPFAGLTFATMANNDSDSNSDDENATLPADTTTRNADTHRALGAGQEAALPPSVQTDSVSRPAEVDKSANVQNFLSTLFSVSSSSASPTASTVTPAAQEPPSTASPVGSPVAPVSKSATARLTDALMSFNALELAIGGGRRKDASGATAAKSTSTQGSLASQQPQPQQNVDYSSYFSTAFDELEDDSEDSLDHLKRVVSIVLQSAKQQQQQQPEEGAVGNQRPTTPKTTGSGGSNKGSSGPSGGGNSMFTLYAGSAVGGGLRDSNVSAEWKSPLGTSLFQGL